MGFVFISFAWSWAYMRKVLEKVYIKLISDKRDGLYAPNLEKQASIMMIHKLLYFILMHKEPQNV